MEDEKPKNNPKEEDAKTPKDITLEEMKDVGTGENYEEISLEELDK